MKLLIPLLFILASCATTRIENGYSMREAIRMNQATIQEAQAFETKVIQQLFPNHTIVGKLKVRKGRRHYDMFVLKNPGGQQHMFYFDMTKFYLTKS